MELKKQPPGHFLNEWRVDMGSRLLSLDQRMSILDISIECGFSSSQMFATVFPLAQGDVAAKIS